MKYKLDESAIERMRPRSCRLAMCLIGGLDKTRVHEAGWWTWRHYEYKQINIE